MSDTQTPTPPASTASFKAIYGATLAWAQDEGVPGFVAQGVAFLVACIVATGQALYSAALFAFVTVGTSLVKACLDVLTKIRADGSADFGAVTAAAMGDFMAIETTDVELKAGAGPAAALARSKQLGDLIIKMLQSQFGEGGPQTPDQGEAAAKALAGYGVNFATTNTFMSWLVELSTDGTFGDFDKLGEDIAQTLGLGRLTRQALRPLVRNAISQPYDRKMRATYRADLLQPAQLVREFLAGRISEGDCDQWIAEHGYSDTFIAALKAQHTPSLHETELELLTAMGAIDAERAAGQLKEQGLPDSIAGWRIQVLTYKRLESLRNRILSNVVAQVNQGLTEPASLDKWLSDLSIPDDEAKLWRQLAGVAFERRRKRIPEGDMLFLYEAAQVTDADLQSFLEDEGYSADDVQLMLTFYRLKAAAATTSKTGGTAAKTAHSHIEHTAYVTDEITGIFGRKPTKAELDYWVELLDLGERTKADFKTELKALDTSGSAIPPSSSQ